MEPSWLADADPASAWAHLAWPEFAHAGRREGALAILPIHGFADHGMGLPWDAEEVLGSSVLRESVQAAAAVVKACVLPPLRFALGPYGHCAFGIDPDTAHRQLQELARGVRDAGFDKLLFFNTSPWNEEWIDAASRDIRQGQAIQTFVVSLNGIGFDFHPESGERALTAQTVAHLLGVPLLKKEDLPRNPKPHVSDAGFRPGQYHYPEPVDGGAPQDVPTPLRSSATRLSRLLVEIVNRPALSQVRSKAPHPHPDFSALKPIPPVTARPFPQRYRARYLPALTAAELDAIPDKARHWVLLPTGAIEQHGAHLPVGVDAILGQGYLAETLAKLDADERLWVAPPITFGKSNEHTGFAGTLTVSAETLRALVRQSVKQLHSWGFRQIAILNTHGGNSAVLVYTLRELQAELELRLGMLNQLFRPELDAQEAAYGFHAGEWETSLMQVLAPALVRMDKAVCEYPAQLGDPGELRPENAPAIFSWISADVSQSGVMGNAPAATREKGVYWLDEYTKSIARRLRELGAPPARGRPGFQL